MGLPQWMARDDSSGAVYLVRTKAELAEMSLAGLQARLRIVRGAISPDGGGLAWMRSAVRRVAAREKRQLESELVRRGDAGGADADR